METEYDGYLLVFHVDPEGRLRVLFPMDPDKDTFVRGDKKYEVRSRGGRDAFEADAKGRGAVYAALSRDPFRFDGMVLGDHWDYRALAPSRLAEDPEPELNELVQRMAQSSFDYDLVSYEVVDRSTYVSEYYAPYYGSVYASPGCWGYSCGYGHYGWPYGFSIGLSFGWPYYSPYSYGYGYPYYNPFFYQPYYYGSYPAYYPGYGYPGRYHGYYNRYYWDRQRYYGSYAGSYGPYRFRGSDGFIAGYRNRGHDLRRSINTAYNRPISRFSGPATASPSRRVVEGRTSELPSRVAPRRTVGHQQPLRRDRVEARRARERETPLATSSGNVQRRNYSGGDSRRTARAPQHDERREPRLERRREEPRRVEGARTAAPEARPQRREAAPSGARPDRGGFRGGGGFRGEGRSSGGGHRPSGGSPPSQGGGRRR